MKSHGGGGGRPPHEPQHEPEEAHRRSDHEAVIRSLIVQNPVALDKLRALALAPRGGFLSHSLRLVVWPKILSLNRAEVPPYRQHVGPNPWSDQVCRDVDRSLWHLQLPQSKKRKRGSRRRVLRDMINAMLCKHPSLQYFQGFHDVMSCIVLVCTDDDNMCFAIAERVALSFLGDYMQRPDFSVLTQLLELLFPLVHAFDAELGRFLKGCGIHASVCLPWVITWFAHDCRDLDKTARLFDAFLSAPPLFSIYVAAAMVLEAKSELGQLEECDFATVHSFLAQLPSRPDLPVETLIVRANTMMRKLPPAKLVRLHGTPQLQALARKDDVYSLHYPPPWHQTHAPPDWLLVEDRRREQGLTVRNKLTRQRRRIAYSAGVHMPATTSSKKNGKKGVLQSLLASPVVVPLHSTLLVGMAAAAAAVMTALVFKVGDGSSVMDCVF